jgi:hypothetical protein
MHLAVPVRGSSRNDGASIRRRHSWGSRSAWRCHVLCAGALNVQWGHIGAGSCDEAEARGARIVPARVPGESPRTRRPSSRDLSLVRPAQRQRVTVGAGDCDCAHRAGDPWPPG